jgi:hypothetical protein
MSVSIDTTSDWLRAGNMKTTISQGGQVPLERDDQSFAQRGCMPSNLVRQWTRRMVEWRGPAAGAQAGRSWERTTEVTMDDSTAPYTLPGALLRDSIQKT